jgi:uncharacterized protein YdiU (UPF0061 family)
MHNRPDNAESTSVESLDDFANYADYSFINKLKRDPHSIDSGEDYDPRQVFSGHYVPVKPSFIAAPEYVIHSASLFRELGFAESLAHTDAFRQFFSGDLSVAPAPMTKIGWATGYALSIYGQEYTQQCPFGTGNAYGDGRAVSVFEGVLNGQRWEMQLKGGGRTPYCRGADGRAVLRSSVREFLAQEHMHALGIATTRSLCLFTSTSEMVQRPWYSEGSYSSDPDVMQPNPVAITTRVAPSFLRVGQLELFGRRARVNAHPDALKELEQIVLHLIEREYQAEINDSLSTEDKLIAMAVLFRDRLTNLIANWLRVGYCQGNFNSDNCGAGGLTLDYGPFGFCERFEPYFQPWTGGGKHFSFLNQPAAARANFDSFCSAIKPLLAAHGDALTRLQAIQTEFSDSIQAQVDQMWASKLGLKEFNKSLVTQLFGLMIDTSVDYTIFFRELSKLPDTLSALQISFYETPDEALMQQWLVWLEAWKACLDTRLSRAELSEQMKQINPKYTWREWMVVPAYEQAMQGDYRLIRELQAVLTHPYDEQSTDVELKYYQLRPEAMFGAGGVAHYSCSS